MLFFFFYGLLLLNIVAFVLFALDKRKARHGKWRIPEVALLLVALLGGSVGALMAMQLFNHKTKKNLFRIGIPVVLLVQLLLLLYVVVHFIAEV